MKRVNGFELRTMAVQGLKPAPYNPRVIEDEQFAFLQNSLTKFGIVEPLIWNKQTRYVVGGNQRLAALRSLGIESTPVLVVDLDRESEQALNIALNRIGGQFVPAMLRPLLQKLQEPRMCHLTGFSADELTVLMDSVKMNILIGASREYDCPFCGHHWTES